MGRWRIVLRGHPSIVASGETAKRRNKPIGKNTDESMARISHRAVAHGVDARAGFDEPESWEMPCILAEQSHPRRLGFDPAIWQNEFRRKTKSNQCAAASSTLRYHLHRRLAHVPTLLPATPPPRG
jgi:hypothetical protein